MIQKNRQNGKTVLVSDDSISIPMIFNKLIGKNSRTNEEYQTYIKHIAIAQMGFSYGKIELIESGKTLKTGLISKNKE